MKTIRINGNEIDTDKKKLTYEEICNIAHPPQETVVYCRGPKSKPAGTIHKGQFVSVVDGMIIDCVFTGNA